MTRGRNKMSNKLDKTKLVPGNIVVIKEQDDVPAHYFELHEVFEDLVGGLAMDGPYMGAYGQPEIEQISHVELERLADSVNGKPLWKKKERPGMYSYWVGDEKGLTMVLDESTDDPMVLKDILIRCGWYGAISGRKDNRTIH